jgi:hypothetical protein
MPRLIESNRAELAKARRKFDAKLYESARQVLTKLYRARSSMSVVERRALLTLLVETNLATRNVDLCDATERRLNELARISKGDVKILLSCARAFVALTGVVSEEGYDSDGVLEERYRRRALACARAAKAVSPSSRAVARALRDLEARRPLATTPTKKTRASKRRASRRTMGPDAFIAWLVAYIPERYGEALDPDLPIDGWIAGVVRAELEDRLRRSDLPEADGMTPRAYVTHVIGA